MGFICLLIFSILFSVSYVVRSYAKHSYRADEAFDKLEKQPLTATYTITTQLHHKEKMDFWLI